LASLTTTTAAKRAELSRPDSAIFAVAGLRQAGLLFDRTGELAALLREADRFRWASLQPATNAYAGEMLMGLADEVHKALGGLMRGDEPAMLNATLGLQHGLPLALLVRRGAVLESENDLLAEARRTDGADSRWTALYRQLVGYAPVPITQASLAQRRTVVELDLYLATVLLLESVLDGEDFAVVAKTVAVIRESGWVADTEQACKLQLVS
jgi:hypothetical protein